MSEMLKLYVRGGFEFVDEDTGFTTSDFWVSDNSLNERVTSRDAPAYEPEIEFVKECIEDGVYDSAAKLAHAVAEVPHVEKIDYVGDLSIGYYGVYVNQLKVKRKSVSVSKSLLRLKTATVPIRGTSPIR